MSLGSGTLGATVLGGLPTTATPPIADPETINQQAVSMRVSRVVNGDWPFGSGKADYDINALAIKQNVQTRLKMFKADYYLNTDIGIDYKNIKDQETLLRDVQQVVLQTEGIMSISKSSVDVDEKRNAHIEITYTDFFSSTFTVMLEL